MNLATLKTRTLTLYIILLFGNGVDSMVFIHGPPRLIKGIKTKAIWMRWDFHLAVSEELILFNCGHLNETTKKMVSLAQETNSNAFSVLTSADSIFRGRVSVMPTTRTFKLNDLSFSDRGKYYCGVVYRNKLTNLLEMKVSPNTTLEVEGVPEFCSWDKLTHITAMEGEQPSFNVTFCSNPPPVLIRYWPHSSAWQEYPTKNIATYKHQGLVTINDVSRDKCGNTMIYQGRNKYGNSVEKRKITFTVKFIPEPPAKLIAYRMNQTCVEATWRRQESGSCVIMYVVQFITSNGETIHTTNASPSHSAFLCVSHEWTAGNITNVNVTAVTKVGAQFAIVDVLLEKPSPQEGRNVSEIDQTILTILGICAGILALASFLCCCCCCKSSNMDGE